MSERVNPRGTRFPAAVGFEEEKADSRPSMGGANKLIDTISRRLIDGNKKLNASNAKEIAKSLNSLGYGDRTNAMLKSILRRTQRGREQGQRKRREAMIVERGQQDFKGPKASAAARAQGEIEAQRSPTELARRQREVAAIRKMSPDVGEREALARSLRPGSGVERFAIQQETASPHSRHYSSPHGSFYRRTDSTIGMDSAEPRAIERTQQLHAAQMLAENTDPSNPFAGMNYQDISRHLDGDSGKHVFEQLFGFPISAIQGTAAATR